MEWDWAPNSTTSEWDTLPQISFWIFWNLLQKYLRTFVSHFATRRLRASVIGFSSKDFFSEKIILGPREVQISWFLVLWSLTHYILRLVFFRDQPTPPICLKMPKCAKFSTFWESHEKNHLQVGVHRENFLIGNLAQNVFMVFYICWEHNISFSAKFPMRKFSPSPSPSLSPESHLLLQNWLKFRK